MLNTTQHQPQSPITKEDSQPQPQLQSNSNNNKRPKKKTTSAVEDCRIELLKNESRLRLEWEGVLFEYEKQIKKTKFERELLLLQMTRTEMGLKPRPLDYSKVESNPPPLFLQRFRLRLWQHFWHTQYKNIIYPNPLWVKSLQESLKMSVLPNLYNFFKLLKHKIYSIQSFPIMKKNIS